MVLLPSFPHGFVSRQLLWKESQRTGGLASRGLARVTLRGGKTNLRVHLRLLYQVNHNGGQLGLNPLGSSEKPDRMHLRIIYSKDRREEYLSSSSYASLIKGCPWLLIHLHFLVHPSVTLVKGSCRCPRQWW